MLLGLFSWLGKLLVSIVEPIVEAAAPIVANVLQAFLEALMPLVIGLITLIIKGLNFNLLIPIAIDVIVTILEVVIAVLFGGKDKITAYIISLIFSTYDFITSPSRLECLSWTPINYIFRGEYLH